MPQHMRGDPFRPVRQVRCRRGASAERSVSLPTRAAVPSMLRRSERNSGAPGRVWSSSKQHHTSSMNHRSVAPAPLISGTIRSRGPDPRAPLPLRTCSFPNRPRSHLTSARSRWLTSLTRSPASAISRAAA